MYAVPKEGCCPYHDLGTGYNQLYLNIIIILCSNNDIVRTNGDHLEDQSKGVWRNWSIHIS